MEHNDDTHFHFEISSSISPVHASVYVRVIEKQYLLLTLYSNLRLRFVRNNIIKANRTMNEIHFMFRLMYIILNALLLWLQPYGRIKKQKLQF